MQILEYYEIRSVSSVSISITEYLSVTFSVVSAVKNMAVNLLAICRR